MWWACHGVDVSLRDSASRGTEHLEVPSSTQTASDNGTGVGRKIVPIQPICTSVTITA